MSDKDRLDWLNANADKILVSKQATGRMKFAYRLGAAMPWKWSKYHRTLRACVDAAMKRKRGAK